MTTPVIQLSSLIAEDLRAIPGPALTNALARLAENPADPQAVIDACLSALAAGEPKRALTLLAGARLSPRVMAALTSWAARLDDNWYPGWVGAETTKSGFGDFIEAQPGDPFEEMLEQVVSNGPIGMLVPRALIEGHLRSGIAPSVQQAASAGISRLDALAQWASARGVQPLWQWTRLAGADMMRRAAMPQCELTLAQARSMAADPAQLALTHMIEGDWYAAPGSSPEAMGFDLAPQGAPSPLGVSDLARASIAWSTAEALVAQIGSAAVPRLAGALALRRSLLARASGDVDGRRRALTEAAALFAGAGDNAGAHLVAIHALIADVDEGRLAGLAIGGGWHQPARGPVFDAIAWASSVGSRSWCVGLGRLLERNADAWRSHGSAARARTLYFAAIALTSIDRGMPTRSLVVAAAMVDSREGLATSALLRLEREFGRLFEVTADTDAFVYAQKLEASLSMAEAFRGLARGPSAPLVARRSELLSEQLAAATDALKATLPAATDALPSTMVELQAAIAQMAGDGSLEAQAEKADKAIALMQQMQTVMAAEHVNLLTVLTHLTRADAAEESGSIAEADRWLDAAITTGEAHGLPVGVRAVALITAQRLDEARGLLRMARDAGEVSDELLLPLALRAEANDLAAAALERLLASGAESGEWRDLLTRAEAFLAQSQPEPARESVLRAIAAFELSARLLVRDPERIEACNQSDVAALFTTLALARIASATPADVDASFDAAERARALSADAEASIDPAGSVARREWERAAAEYAAAERRTLATIGDGFSEASAEQFDRLAMADAGLAEAELALDSAAPGFLTRRTEPPAWPSAAEVRRRIPEGTLLLEYLVAGPDVIGWAMTHDAVRVTRGRMPSRELRGSIRAFHSSCATGRALATTPLTALLLEPFAELIRQHPRIVVVPFGALSLVPFHALRFDGAPLGLTHVVSYGLSGADAFSSDVDAAANVSESLVVGDPAFDPTAHPDLPSLPGARIEAAAVARALGLAESSLLIGADATEASVTERLSRCQLLHVSSHGHLDELSPFSSSLTLSGRDELTMADIVGLSLGTDLAVLTGCDTGRGAATLGGDLVGLTRALLRSGVGRTVVSMWPVDDAVAPVLMRDFYAGIAAGLAPAPALAGAQRSMASMSATELRDAYASLGGDAAAGGQRRGLELPPELRDEEEMPEPLGGDAERFWASFILVG